jgi:hypothetical protein
MKKFIEWVKLKEGQQVPFGKAIADAVAQSAKNPKQSGVDVVTQKAQEALKKLTSSPQAAAQAAEIAKTLDAAQSKTSIATKPTV